MPGAGGCAKRVAQRVGTLPSEEAGNVNARGSCDRQCKCRHEVFVATYAVDGGTQEKVWFAGLHLLGVPPAPGSDAAEMTEGLHKTLGPSACWSSIGAKITRDWGFDWLCGSQTARSMSQGLMGLGIGGCEDTQNHCCNRETQHRSVLYIRVTSTWCVTKHTLIMRSHFCLTDPSFCLCSLPNTPPLRRQ